MWFISSVALLSHNTLKWSAILGQCWWPRESVLQGSSALSEFHTSLSKVLTLWHSVKVNQRYHNGLGKRCNQCPERPTCTHIRGPSKLNDSNVLLVEWFQCFSVMVNSLLAKRFQNFTGMMIPAKYWNRSARVSLFWFCFANRLVFDPPFPGVCPPCILI